MPPEALIKYPVKLHFLYDNNNTTFILKSLLKTIHFQQTFFDLYDLTSS